jgi:hypothetical protein
MLRLSVRASRVTRLAEKFTQSTGLAVSHRGQARSGTPGGLRAGVFDCRWVQGLPIVGARRVSPDRMSARDVDVDGLVGHCGDEVVGGARYTGIGARERLARANRAERALVHRSGVDAAHDDLEALRLQLADGGIDGRWASRGGGSGSGQSERGGSQCARCEGGDEDVLVTADGYLLLGFVCRSLQTPSRFSADPPFRCNRRFSCGFGCLPRRNSQAEEPSAPDR